MVSRVVPGISVTIARSSQQRVEERRLPRVGPAGQHGERPLAQQLALRRGGQEPADHVAHAGRRRGCARARRAARPLRGSRWSRRSGRAARHRVPQLLDPAGEAALHLVHGGAVQRRRGPSIRSATASACSRSSLPLRYARRVNSPGAAARAPAARSASSTLRGVSTPPWVEISTVSSPV